jgi:hypothetical protein
MALYPGMELAQEQASAACQSFNPAVVTPARES